MCRGHLSRMLSLVSAQTVHIAIDASSDGEEIRGHIGDGISAAEGVHGMAGVDRLAGWAAERAERER